VAVINANLKTGQVMHDWESLREEHGGAIWRIVFRIVRNESEAMDCFQEVFSEAIEKSYIKPLDNPAGLLRWLAVRRAIDYRRRSEKLRSESPVDERLPDHKTWPADKELLYSELMERVRSELKNLPPSQAEAFWLCCIEEMPVDQIASVMQLRKGHVSVLVHRARKHLQNALQQLKDHERPLPASDPITFKGEQR
jgi:RNA polymerase sigma factor (sigma-70 family)